MSRLPLRIARGLLCLLIVAGCAQPSTPPDPEPPKPQVPTEAPTGSPHLLLTLPLGEEQEQPGRLPSRVGGVSPRGPLALAVAEPSTLYLLDAARGRILRYEGGELVQGLLTPWATEWGGDLRLEDGGLVMTSERLEVTLAPDGRILDLRSLPYQEVVPVDRAALAGLPLPAEGDLVDWFETPAGGIYSLSWLWGREGIETALVHELRPPATAPAGDAGAELPTGPDRGPGLFNRPVPSRIILRFPDWAPVEVTDPVARWNLWRLLATAGPAAHPPVPGSHHVRLEADFPDGDSLVLDLRGDDLVVEGVRYTVGAPGAMHSLIDALRSSEAGLTGALTAADSVTVILADLDGVERPLTPAERRQLSESLRGAIAVNPFSAPQPLEAPFPQYKIHLEGDAWKGELILKGERHLQLAHGGAAVHSGELAALVRAWLPVPALTPDQVGYLFRADRLEIGQGNDLTRWKNTVVRRLLHPPSGEVQVTYPEPFTLTFYVDGEALTVRVDRDGFIYNGKRYPGAGLTDLQGLQGVP